MELPIREEHLSFTLGKASVKDGLVGSLPGSLLIQHTLRHIAMESTLVLQLLAHLIAAARVACAS